MAPRRNAGSFDKRGSIPYTELFKKYELTDISENEDDTDQFFRESLKDTSPDVPYLESDIPPSSNRGDRMGILNLHLTGTRGNKDWPKHPEMHLEIHGKDPRGTATDVDWSKLRDFSLKKEKWMRKNMHPDGGRADNEGGLTQNELNRLRKKQFYALKGYRQNFDDQEVNLVSGQSIHTNPKAQYDFLLADARFKDGDKVSRTGPGISQSKMPMSQKFASALHDGKFAIAQYGTKGRTPIHLTDQSKGRNIAENEIKFHNNTSTYARKMAIISDIKSKVDAASMSAKYGESKQLAVRHVLETNKDLVMKLINLEFENKTFKSSQHLNTHTGKMQTNNPNLRGEQFKEEYRKQLLCVVANTFMGGLKPGDNKCSLVRKIQREMRRVVIDEKTMSTKQSMLFDKFTVSKQRQMTTFEKIKTDHKIVKNYKQNFSDPKHGRDSVTDANYGKQDNVIIGKTNHKEHQGIQANDTTRDGYDHHQSKFLGNDTMRRKIAPMGKKYMRRYQDTSREVSVFG